MDVQVLKIKATIHCINHHKSIAKSYIENKYLKNVSGTPDMVSSFNANTWTNLILPLHGNLQYQMAISAKYTSKASMKATTTDLAWHDLPIGATDVNTSI